MRNIFKYEFFDERKLLVGLLNASKKEQFVSILTSNSNKKAKSLPKEYVNYNIIAAVGCISKIASNKNSLKKMRKFADSKNDWLFGYLSYDLKNEIENLSSNNLDNFSVDNLCFFCPKYVLLYKNNHLEIHTYECREKCDNFILNLKFDKLKIQQKSISLKSRDSKVSYLNKINKIMKHIKKGNIYEMNYCQEYFADNVNIFPETFFWHLNKKMEMPFSCFMKIKDKYIISSSPERYIKKTGDTILSQPIKGTTARGTNKLEDDKLKKMLIESRKDIAENIMITDLVRNDLSITASKSSVKVDDLCSVFSFKRIHQMITSITSKLDDNFDYVDVIESTFPMGSMTGAPKIKAMELIEKFETFKRGFFSGAVGYINPNLDFDFNVIIRTILYCSSKKYLSLPVGSAITINSDSIAEYEECIVKIKPILEILNLHLND